MNHVHRIDTIKDPTYYFCNFVKKSSEFDAVSLLDLEINDTYDGVDFTRHIY